MESGSRVNRRFRRWRACCFVLAAASCLACPGCMGSDGSAKRWLDPLGLTSRRESSDEPEFRKRVNKDPFPSASQVGLAAPAKSGVE
jgi:hypothetical protein